MNQTLSHATGASPHPSPIRWEREPEALDGSWAQGAKFGFGGVSPRGGPRTGLIPIPNPVKSFAVVKLFYKIARWYLKRHQLAIVPAGELDRIKELEKAWPEYHRFKEEVVREGNLSVRWAGMGRLLKRNITIGTIIDVGAADGVSATEMTEHFPDARFLLIEAEQKHQPALAALQAKNSKMEFVIATAGMAPGEVFFGGPGHDLYEGKASEQNFEGSRKTKMTTSIARWNNGNRRARSSLNWIRMALKFPF